MADARSKARPESPQTRTAGPLLVAVTVPQRVGEAASYFLEEPDRAKYIALTTA